MAQQDTPLPEGTDKIIDGSMETGGGTEGREQIGATETTGGLGSGSGSQSDDALLGTTGGSFADVGARSGTGGGSTGSTGSALMDKVRSGGKDLSGQAADKARGLVGQGLERGSEALANVSRMIGDTADGIEERLGPEYGDYARRAATSIETTASNLAAKDPDELIDDTREFIRKSPGVALAGAAIAGFAIARLLKSGLSGATEGRDKEGRGDRA